LLIRETANQYTQTKFGHVLAGKCGLTVVDVDERNNVLKAIHKQTDIGLFAIL